ncbi:MAG TPA: methyltransferase domain-containing protein [Vicinamibacterales bacterium]|nr:methyltransferase domain-containing protein [Vicinamibacterales bacterium]
METGNPTHWDIASEGWLRCSALYEPFEEPVNTRLIELAEIAKGYRVVDVATGIGDPALSVAKRVGSTGRVIATDQSPAMLAIAERRARDRGLTNIEFRLLDANEFDFPDRTIDAIVCRWGLMFLSDLADALRRMRRSLKSGRCLAAATWGDPDKVPIISVRRSVMRAFDIPQGPLDPFRLASATSLSAAATCAEFEEVAVTRSIVPYEYLSADAFASAQRTAHESRLTTLLARSEEQQAEFWRAMADAARPYASASGVVHMPSEILLLAARKGR